MKMSAIFGRRGLYGAFATCALGGVAAATIAMPTANAAPCTASGFAATAGDVLRDAGGYLADHPGANDVLTAAGTQPAGQAESSVRAYFTAHPTEYLELQRIVGPLTGLRNQCGVSVTPGQLATLFDALAA
jgi:hemophore-related protein